MLFELLKLFNYDDFIFINFKDIKIRKNKYLIKDEKILYENSLRLTLAYCDVILD